MNKGYTAVAGDPLHPELLMRLTEWLKKFD